MITAGYGDGDGEQETARGVEEEEENMMMKKGRRKAVFLSSAKVKPVMKTKNRNLSERGYNS